MNSIWLIGSIGLLVLLTLGGTAYFVSTEQWGFAAFWAGLTIINLINFARLK